MNNEIRNQKQLEFAEKLQKFNKAILLSSIRFGKTRVGLLTIKKEDKVLICYPRVVIKDSWIRDIEKFGVASNQISYSTFASLKKLEGKYDYIIVDEFHKLSAGQKIQLFKLMKDRILLITGTLNSRKKKFWREKGYNVIINYNLEDAIRDNLVKDYRIYVHYVKLTKEERLKYNNLSFMIDKLIEKKDEAVLFGNSHEIKKFDLASKKYIGQRTNLLYNSQVTKDYAKTLTEALENEKVLIFSLRTSVADELAEKAFHSKSKNNNHLEEFKVSEKGHLSTVNVINEGITISHLNNIICHSITSNTEDFQQKLGRGLQLSEVDGEVCKVHLLCIEDTVSEKWTEEACKSLNQEKIFLYKFGVLLPKIEYIKDVNPDKELYLYEGSFCYKTEDNMYRFLGDKIDRKYSLNRNSLIPL